MVRKRLAMKAHLQGEANLLGRALELVSAPPEVLLLFVKAPVLLDYSSVRVSLFAAAPVGPAELQPN